MDFQKLLDNISLNIYWLDRDNFFLSCNNFYAHFLRVVVADLIGHKFDDILRKSKIKVLDNENYATASPGTRTFKRTYSFNNGTKKSFLVYECDFFDQENTTHGKMIIEHEFAHSNEEIVLESQLARINKEKTATEIYLDNVLKIMPASIYWKDSNGVILGDNLIHAKITGLGTPIEVVGKTDYDFIWKDQADKIIENDKIVMQSAETHQFEETALLSDGQQHTFLTSKSPLRDKKDGIIGVIGVSIDISDRKQMELELAAAKNAAEVANKLKTEFLENMQHDLRTPASGIYSALEMLIDSKDHQQNLEILPIIAKSAKELLAVCNEVIDFEQHENGRHAIQSKNLNIRDLATHIINLNSTASYDKGIQLLLEIDDDIPENVQGDSYRLKKILTNLIGNSLKFTKEGAVKLFVRLLSKKENSASIQFEISDSGMGIPEDKIDLIFEKFTRLNPSNQGLYKGTGLGLSLVKKFVEELGGCIEVKSKINVGTQFFINLSFVIPEITIQQLASIGNEPTRVNIVESAAQEQPNILIIEDHMLACMVAKKVFEKLNCRVTIAKDVKESLESLTTKKFDLVVSDLGLPDGTGFDIIKSIKEDQNAINNETPFVALTAHNDEAKKLECINAGFLDMLSKPIQAEIAQQVLQLYLKISSDQSNIEEFMINMEEAMDSEIFDLTATKNRLGTSANEFILNIIDACLESLVGDRLLIENSCKNNDIQESRNLLHKIEGALCYISAPRLHKALLTLHDAVRNTSELSSLDAEYKAAYQEIDLFLKECIKIKKILT